MINQFSDVIDAFFIVEAGPRLGQTIVATGTVIRLKYISLHILLIYILNHWDIYSQYNLTHIRNTPIILFIIMYY